jgi:hypothetical protein
VFGDIDNPPEAVEQLISRPWELSPTFEPPAKVQIKSLRAQLELLEAEIQAIKDPTKGGPK